MFVSGQQQTDLKKTNKQENNHFADMDRKCSVSILKECVNA